MYQSGSEYVKISITIQNGGNVMEDNKEFTDESVVSEAQTSEPDAQTTVSEQADTYESPEVELQHSNLQAMPVPPIPQQAEACSQPVEAYDKQVSPMAQQQTGAYSQQVPPTTQPAGAYNQPVPPMAQQQTGTYSQPVPPTPQPMGAYNQQPYGQPQYTQPQYAQPKQKGDGIGFGIASMVLGIASILLFCTCINIVTAILAIIFGIIQIVKNKNKAFAIAGISTAAVALVLTMIFWVAVGSEAGNSMNNMYNNMYDDDEWFYRNYDMFDDIR